jgi:hypothetical protein
MGHTERVPGVRGLLLAALALACLATPSTAGAHLRSGTVAVDYQASVRRPETPAYTSQIFQSDRALGLTVKPGHTVVLLGYLGEPVFRLDDAGLWLNQNSPTAAADRLVPKLKATTGSGPRWRLRRGHHSVAWQDARVQGLPAGVVRGPWSVPVIVDGHRARLEGQRTESYSSRSESASSSGAPVTGTPAQRSGSASSRLASGCRKARSSFTRSPSRSCLPQWSAIPPSPRSVSAAGRPRSAAGSTPEHPIRSPSLA